MAMAHASSMQGARPPPITPYTHRHGRLQNSIVLRPFHKAKCLATAPAADTHAAPEPLDTWLDRLNPSQVQAVTAAEQLVCVKAGPGSGKTRIIISRIAYLIEETKVPHNKILAITFTRKAAQEIKTRLADVLGRESADKIRAGTFHSLCSQIVRTHVHPLKSWLNQRFVVMDEDDATMIMRQVIDDMDQFIDMETSQRTPLATWLVSLFDSATNKTDTTHKSEVMGAAVHAFITQWGFKPMGSPGYLKACLTPNVLQYIHDQYKRSLRECNAVDYSDLLSMAVYLMQQPAIRQHWQEKYTHVLVDEFQDTNTPQYSLVKLLMGDTGNLFAVGDPDQAIYGFRDANPRIMLHTLRDDYPHARYMYLTDNYRSVPQVLQAANHVLSHGGRPHLHQPVKPVRPSNPGAVKHISSEDQEDEAAQIANTIQRLKRNGRSLHDIAILVRTNADATSIESGLQKHGVNCRVMGAVGFFDSAVIKDMVAFMRWVLNPDDSTALIRVLKALSGKTVAAASKGKGKATDKAGHKRAAIGAGDSTLNKLREFVKEQEKDMTITLLLTGDLHKVWLPTSQLDSALQDLVDGHEPRLLLPKDMIPGITSVLPAGAPKLRSDIAHRLDNLRATLVLMRSALRYKGVQEVVDVAQGLGQYSKHATERQLGYLSNFRKQAMQPNDWATLDSLEPSAVQGDDLLALEDMAMFVNYLKLAREVEEEDEMGSEGSKDKVHIMTLHKSKGLEYPVVFLVGVEEGTMPFNYHMKGGPPPDVEEEKRLLYVGCTRAMDQLYICTARERGKYGKTERPMKSRFIRGLDIRV